MHPTNTAAWQIAEKAKPLEIRPVAYTPPKENEIVVKNGAIGLNPVDYLRQEQGAALFSWTTYPTIMGTDVAGEVVEVGSGAAAARFKRGDRVLGLGSELKDNNPAEGAFQHYTVIPAQVASPIPADLSYENAAVIPLGISTAGCGLFQKDYLALQLPTSPRAASSGQLLLIWSGSSSVGSNAIQLAAAAGYEVVTTASAKNFEYVRSLGASHVFDYRSPTLIEDIRKVYDGKTGVGALAIGTEAAGPCCEILSKVNSRKFVSLTNPPSGALPEGIESKFVFGAAVKDNEVGPAIFEAFLPKALAAGEFKPAPTAAVVGKGLGSIQEGLDQVKKGVSAKKYVISLQ
ncbi:zinc-binding alcohol dehydrogenase domain-containing protein cipB [Aspergillus udagawae]|nr:zinc-binding alcohol dehydrogenase domain-containing protein cipB [Aspergillus udagawae]GFG01262.1 zinc-binding alcohol dehydrogenase domain-containing protein cipB [Aspergillus udagawae]GFG22499.1 zinc-binding alcohol dehydrogenase domain-containing protein cipB [Aspergillus udagawae]